MNHPVFSAFSHFQKPFVIGLHQLEDQHNFHLDENAADYIGQKRALWRSEPDGIFKAKPDSLTSQQEVQKLVAGNLARYHPDHLAETNNAFQISGVEKPLIKAAYTHAPLMLASLLVQDDLVIMHNTGSGWILSAGSVCFPSSWKLSEKFGRPLEGIHAPVPGLNDQLAPMINRIFDNLRPELPVWRENWSLEKNDDLRQSHGEGHRRHKKDQATDISKLFVRGEYQTLRKMHESGDILFTIKIIIKPLNFLESCPVGAALSSEFKGHLSNITPEQACYKGLNKIMPELLQYLRQVAGNAAHTTS